MRGQKGMKMDPKWKAEVASRRKPKYRAAAGTQARQGSSQAREREGSAETQAREGSAETLVLVPCDPIPTNRWA